MKEKWLNMNRKKRWAVLLLMFFLPVYLGTIYYHEHKPLPEGVSYAGKTYKVQEGDIDFIYDLTYQTKDGTKKEHHLFNQVFKMIEEAEEFIVLDFFLYNDYYDQGMEFPPLSSQLTSKLLEKKAENPDVEVVLITDKINTSYGSHRNRQFEELQDQGVKILYTDVDPLRDSNPLYSAGWRMFIQWFGQRGEGRVKNVMADQAPDMTVRSYLKLLNVKANHRKTVTTDKGTMILSANPHDASANHSNIGFMVKGPIIADVLESEQAAANLAGGYKLPAYEGPDDSTGDIDVQLLTEGKVLSASLNAIEEAENGDQIWMAMFYLAERKVIEALLQAEKRGVDIKLILDPNENAFGSKKTGLPNRPVARELHKKTDGGIQIRWYNTDEEQYHPKLLYIKKQNGDAIAIGGSTNFTARNLDDYNLETDVYVKAPAETEIADDLERFFQRQWDNEQAEYTLGFEAYQDGLTPFQRIIYAIQKALSFTTY